MVRNARLRSALTSFGALVVAAIALFAIAQACGGHHAPRDSDEDELSTGRCAIERGSIKMGSDADAGLVNLTPVDTTVAALTSIPQPSNLGQNTPRYTFSGSPELQNYRLTNVHFTWYKAEADSDYHLVVEDQPGGAHMIVEIPDPACMSGAWASGVAAARAAFDAVLTASTSSFQNADQTVTLTGVGYFDPAHGTPQRGVAPNNLELHSVLSLCFGQDCGGTPPPPTPDFGLTVSPQTVTSVAGGTDAATISVSAIGPFTDAVALTVSGVPGGASASFNQASATPGGSVTLTLATGSAAVGSSTLTITGTSPSGLTHTAALTWNIAAVTPATTVINNGGFEPDLSGWTSTGVTSSSADAHSGLASAQVGSADPSGNSHIDQTFTVPAGGGTLSFWYKSVCTDASDWATATLYDTVANTYATVLGHTCSNDGWHQVTYDLSASAGNSVNLRLTNFDDGYAGDGSYTLFDDVMVQ